MFGVYTWSKPGLRSPRMKRPLDRKGLRRKKNKQHLEKTVFEGVKLSKMLHFVFSSCHYRDEALMYQINFSIYPLHLAVPFTG